jgi:hypothetical protein
VSIGNKEIKAFAGFLGDRDFNLPDLKSCLSHMATARAKHAGSMAKACRIIAGAMPDKNKQQIAAILLRGKRGKPNSIKQIERLAAEELLTNFTIYKNTEAPKKITAADFAEWYLPSEFCPEKQRRKLPLTGVDIQGLQNRLSKARHIVNHAG